MPIQFVEGKIFFLDGKIAFACCCGGCEGECCPNLTTGRTVYLTFSDFVLDSGHTCTGISYDCLPADDLVASFTLSKGDVGDPVMGATTAPFIFTPSITDPWRTNGQTVACNTDNCSIFLSSFSIFRQFGCRFHFGPLTSTNDNTLSGFNCDPIFWEGTIGLFFYTWFVPGTVCGTGSCKVTITE